ncbi:MAG TPA: PEP-CTERM sorting domain-containing protein [Candidatus Acidoferrum sp.]|nr:PEP-CTERM sorting domain-containing protein [Candidatus Acidoferrum sp.]
MASLSALGAGALVFGAGRAEAGIIYSGILDTHVGFTSGIPFYASPGIGPLGATFSFTAQSSYHYGVGIRQIIAYGCGCLELARQGSLLQLFNFGAIWTAGLVPGTAMAVGARIWGTASTGTSSTRHPVQFSNTLGNKPFDHLYSLFQFDDGSNTLYGWIQLSYSVSGQFGPDAIFGPELTIHNYAWDDSGAPLPAGQSLDASQIPEPATAVSTGLAALALGAVGLRQWRKTREPA